MLALLKPTLEARFHWTDRDYAHMGSVSQIAAAGSLLFVGWFVDRVGVRRALGLGVGLWSIATLLAGIAHGYAHLLAARALVGIGEAAFVAIAAAMLAASSASSICSIVSLAPLT